MVLSFISKIVRLFKKDWSSGEMRKIIADEGVDIPPNIYIVGGGIWWEPDDVIPVTVPPIFDRIGWASDIRREGQVLTAELDCEIPEAYKCSFLLSDDEEHQFKDTIFITTGRIREVTIYSVPGVPDGE